MASTNKTTNLQLSQFESSDIVSFLTDYNSDMEKIDQNVARITPSTGKLINMPTAEDVGAAPAEQVARLSNPNLLINSDFRIHQRGDSFTGLYNSGSGKYTADRCMIYCISSSNSYLTVTCSDNGGLTITNSRSSSTSCYARYYMDDSDIKALAGKKLGITYSIDGVKSYELVTVSSSRRIINKLLSVPGSGSLTLDWWKAEAVDDSATSGTVSKFVTPYIPRPIASEFADCLYYTRFVKSFSALQMYYDGSGANFDYRFDTMRVAPTTTYRSATMHRASDGTVSDIQPNIEMATVPSDEKEHVRFHATGITADGLLVVDSMLLDAEIYS